MPLDVVLKERIGDLLNTSRLAGSLQRTDALLPMAVTPQENPLLITVVLSHGSSPTPPSAGGELVWMGLNHCQRGHRECGGAWMGSSEPLSAPVALNSCVGIRGGLLLGIMTSETLNVKFFLR